MKKIKNNQLGFGAAEAVLIVIIVCLIGVVGWSVHDKSQNKTTHKTNSTTSPTTNARANATTVKPTKQTATYTDSIAGYSFEYPKDWTVSVKKDSGYFDKNAKTLTTFNIVTVKSPDYQDNGVDGNGNTVTKGGAFVLQSTPPQYSSPTCQDAQKCVTVDGQKASQVTYNPGPEGGYWIATIFTKNNAEYDVNYSFSNGNQDQYYSQYNNLLGSFKTNK
jgi:hypothetical protein